ncbi:MLRP2-like protein [Mya arenaria]|uniref:MLRP2-like protein n=1 Tax=Mya arenaria TaxID=6604 RepID=A0ABY7E1U3_MYAAR|nr:MLRP2-like protein [Mya arenaria]
MFSPQVGSNLGSAVWTKSGTQGNLWQQGQATLVSKTSTYNIAFEGIVGPGYRGDIGLDDIKLITGACPSGGMYSLYTCFFIKLFSDMYIYFFLFFFQFCSILRGIACTFDNGLCGWQQSRADTFDWLQRKGSTGSAGTGPTNDHTTNTRAGTYMYIESSSPRRPGDKAWLVSSYATTTAPQCLSFYYSMYGVHIGSLNVYVMTGTALPSAPVFSKSGNQGNQWFMGQATLQSTQKYRVRNIAKKDDFNLRIRSLI